MEQAYRILEISRSSYYDWLKQKPDICETIDQALKRKLVELHEKYPMLGFDSLYHMSKLHFPVPVNGYIVKCGWLGSISSDIMPTKPPQIPIINIPLLPIY